ncbi:hypothetical protein JJD41_16430 [Oxynema sp. CENA135]|uniref:hypothetical protein n=1 Tax=Oxynema sp. CENA135 TaxID=984206 RepID=UPI00190D7480|nr:hypothetical protein [Oxynema sp. CENA135]MBK4731438.1 hypothetical protein [Oxynema sp. CENA135]
MQQRLTASLAMLSIALLGGSASAIAAGLGPMETRVSPQGEAIAFWWNNDDDIDPEGIWNIREGEAPNGNEYTGTVEIEAIGDPDDRLYRLQWETSEGDYTGLGFVEDGKLLVGYGREAEIYGVALYKIEDDGNRLDGRWSLSTADGNVGTEKATGGRSGRLEGEYRTVSTDPGRSESSYDGRLTIEPDRDAYQVTWEVDDETYRGVGLRSGDWFVVGWGPGENFAVLEYDLDDDEAEGRWAVWGVRNFGQEKITR